MRVYMHFKYCYQKQHIEQEKYSLITFTSNSSQIYPKLSCCWLYLYSFQGGGACQHFVAKDTWLGAKNVSVTYMGF